MISLRGAKFLFEVYYISMIVKTWLMYTYEGSDYLRRFAMPYYHLEIFIGGIIFLMLYSLSGLIYSVERFDYMPDSHKTTCAKGSVPAANGLDCKLPSDRYGL